MNFNFELKRLKILVLKKFYSQRFLNDKQTRSIPNKTVAVTVDEYRKNDSCMLTDEVFNYSVDLNKLISFTSINTYIYLMFQVNYSIQHCFFKHQVLPIRIYYLLQCLSLLKERKYLDRITRTFDFVGYVRDVVTEETAGNNRKYRTNHF